eukprot:NODE_2721_length_451_cov_225.896341_g2700_i0.p1 GENE.NODE_2721_length_451_cov_225.896341_g2700_i0~~NODE_2721_length_451_cov_225.896341_g2700_i0.p1  ORF type:complete len:110 (+),score=20.66 NODE_2721_length_451_cov_225.896341_g2700_i0:20-349(+)
MYSAVSTQSTWGWLFMPTAEEHTALWTQYFLVLPMFIMFREVGIQIYLISVAITKEEASNPGRFPSLYFNDYKAGRKVSRFDKGCIRNWINFFTGAGQQEWMTHYAHTQ